MTQQYIFMITFFYIYIYTSVKNHNSSVCNIKINYSQEDFQMKKLLLNLLVVMSNDSAAAQVRHTVQVLVMISVNAVQNLNMTNNHSSIKRNGLFWLC